MASKFFLKWVTGLTSVAMFTYFAGLSHQLDSHNLTVSDQKNLSQSDIQTSNQQNIKDEWNGSNGQVGNNAGSSPNQLNKENVNSTKHLNQNTTTLVKRENLHQGAVNVRHQQVLQPKESSSSNQTRNNDSLGSGPTNNINSSNNGLGSKPTLTENHSINGYIPNMIYTGRSRAS